MSSTTNTRAIPALTGIRFLAAVYVFVYHYGAGALDQLALPRPLNTFLHNGFFGVSMFFVLSGFILAHSHPQPFAAPADYSDYAVARFARIYPVYLLALLLALPVPSNPILHPSAAVEVVAMTQSWGNGFSDTGYVWIFQAWTLSAEIFFYLMFPFLLTFMRRLSTPLLLCWLLLNVALLVDGGTSKLHPMIYLDNVHEFPDWALFAPLPLARAVEFSLGVALYLMLQRLQLTTVRHASLWLSILLAALIALLVTTHEARLIACATVVVALIIAVLSLADNAATRLLGSRPLYVLGSASYALYLLENPCHSYMVRYLPGWGRLLVLPVTILLSVLVWQWYETPARRWISGLRRKPAVAVPALLPAGGAGDARSG